MTLGFGLNTNKTAQEFGYDQYQTTLKESLGATAGEAWEYNPLNTLTTYYQLENAKNNDIALGPAGSGDMGVDPVDKKILNKEYSSLGLYFEEDEYQSVVDIKVRKKREELGRRSIMQRGPESSWNPLSSGFYVGAAKLGVGVGVSFLDPINIGASFIPVFGQVRFAKMLSKPFMNLNRARAVRGAVEGAVGASVLEPFIYGVAQKVQADYDLYDSFMNVGFGTVLGSGLHVGAGKLKDMNTAEKFQQRVIKNRENLNSQNEIITDTLDLPTKINVGESFSIFDVSGNVVNAEIVAVSSSGNTVRVKLADGSEKLINLDATSPDFQNIKSSNYTIRSAGLGTNIQGRSISDLSVKESDTLREQLLARKDNLEKEGKTKEGVYNDTIRDLNALEFNANKSLVDAEPEVNLYKEYYPVNGEFMMRLEQTDPKTRELLLAKAIGDLSLNNRVDVTGLLNRDPNLRRAAGNPPTTEIKNSPKVDLNDSTLDLVNENVETLTPEQQDTTLNRLDKDLLNLRNAQTDRGLDLKLEPAEIDSTIKQASDALNEVNSKSVDIEEAITDAINCANGR